MITAQKVWFVIVAGVFLLGSIEAAEGAGPCQRMAACGLYAKQASLAETLLEVRVRYSAWQVEQPRLRKGLELGPWSATPPLADDVQKQVRPADRMDLHARLADGRELWSPRKDLVDGKSNKLHSGSGDTAVFLHRTIRAPRAMRLTVGVGGGDRLEAWLGGRPVLAADTRLTSGRYGCAYRVDGTRVDQALVDLELQAGENGLLLRVTLGEEPSVYFSAAPNPVPRLWEQIRRDFPAAENPLLDLVPAAWFDRQGWFAAQDAASETQLVEGLAADYGGHGAPLRTELAGLQQARVGRSDRRWLDVCVRAAAITTLHRDLLRLRAAVEELGRLQGDGYRTAEALAQLGACESRLAALARPNGDPSGAAARQLLADVPPLRRRLLVEWNPLVTGAEIAFVKRRTYNSKHYYDDFQHVSSWGGGICALNAATGQVRPLAPALADGVYDRYDISFDARRIAFGLRRARPEGFRIYEVDLDTGRQRPVTRPPDDEARRIAAYGKTSTGDSFYGSLGYQFWTDDVHPCYLPDGGFCFASTRCEHGVLCTPAHYLACTNLFRTSADGSGMRALSHGALSEFTPTLMDDGRILYNRWEYVYKGIAAVQPLWTMRPDGSGNEEYYGNNVTNPGVLWQARQIPGQPRMAVCIGCGHEPLGIGAALLLDLNKSKRTLEPIKSLTPDTRTQNLRGLYQLRNGQWKEDIYGPFYSDPYPLSDKFFLVSCNPDRRYNDETAYGLFLLDAFGNRVPIYSDAEYSCWQPMPLRARVRPPVLPARETPVAAESAPARLFVSDVYRGLEGVPRGTVKYLRVMEQIPKPWAAEVDPARGEDRTADGIGGHLAVSWNAHIWIAVLRGIAPVEADGSACFEVPARRNLFFQALDENFMEVQRMRTFINLEPGEQRSCIGCHEHRTQAPAGHAALALTRPPATLAAQPGEVAPRALYYPTDVQPIFDRHCVRCHDGHDPKAAPDLRGELTTQFSRSYENLLEGKQVDAIREWNGGGYAMENAPAVPPYSHGSHRSKLVDLLRRGHYESELSREEWIKLVTWIDCGAPYYGSYFGRRNLRYRGQPDFRPAPSVDSACGIAPPLVKLPAPDPLPAQLLAWWALGASGDDASGQNRPLRIVEAAPCPGRPGHEARRFTGKSYAEAVGLGSQQAASIAMWMNAESFNPSWNPLWFGNEAHAGTLHFSLLADGTPNVAINCDGRAWTHRKASAAVGVGAWRHVVLVCDGRPSGSVRFYIDGKPAGSERLGVGVNLDLSACRIGAWNRWERQTRNNFHGAIGDVRVYSGLLTDAEAAALARPTP